MHSNRPKAGSSPVLVSLPKLTCAISSGDERILEPDDFCHVCSMSETMVRAMTSPRRGLTCYFICLMTDDALDSPMASTLVHNYNPMSLCVLQLYSCVKRLLDILLLRLCSIFSSSSPLRFHSTVVFIPVINTVLIKIYSQTMREPWCISHALLAMESRIRFAIPYQVHEDRLFQLPRPLSAVPFHRSRLLYLRQRTFNEESDVLCFFCPSSPSLCHDHEF